MRNSNNTNQHLYFKPTFKGFPVQTARGPLIEGYLKALHGVFVRAIESHQRLFMVRIDLRYSLRFDLAPDADTNGPVIRFIHSLTSQLNHKENKRRKQGLKVNRHDMRCAWAREIGEESGVPHYHMVLIFNGSAYRSLGNYSDPEAPGLYQLMHRAWARATGVPEDLAGGLVSLPSNGHWYVKRSEQDFVKDAFHASSYLCKAATKRFELGVHCFGCSRRPPIPRKSRGVIL